MISDIPMYISKTPHVLAIYLAVGIFLIGFPLTRWWARLVGWLDGLGRIERWYPVSVVIITAILAHLTVLVMNAFQYDKENSRISFETFCTFSFFLMPIGLPFLAEVIPHLRAGAVRPGTLLAYLFAVGGFGSAATNIHDVIWCWKATNGYTVERFAGIDLDFWTNTLHTGTKDYRIFGFYMVVQIIIALAASHVILARLPRLGKIGYSHAFIPFCWLGMAAMAFGITILDWPDTFENHFYNLLSVSIGIIVSMLLFYSAGAFAKFKTD